MATTFDATPLLKIIDAPEPHGRLWEELCARIDAPATLRAAPQWLPEVTARLDATWDDRERVWPLKWLKRKDPHPAASIARSLRLHDTTAAQQQKVLAHLAMLDATNMPPITSFEATTLGRSRGARVSAADAAVVWAALGHARLRRVMIDNEVCELAALVDVMADQPALAGVEALVLDHLSDEALGALAGSPALGALKRLSLRGQGKLTVAGNTALRGLSGQLEHLHLSNQFMGSQRVDSAAWRALWAAPWVALREVSLNLKLQSGALPALLAATPALEQLRLSGAALHDAAPEQPCQTLQRLELASVSADDEDIAALLDGLPGLRALSLRYETELGPRSAEAIGRLEALQSLELRNEAACAEAWEVLAAEALARIEVLQVGERAVGMIGAVEVPRALAGAHMPALKVLDLSQITLTDAQIEALVGLRLPGGAVIKYDPHRSPACAETARKLHERTGHQVR